MNYLILVRWAAIVWTVIMLIGCLTPHDQLPDTLLSWSDKLQHIAIFALFGALWCEAGFRLSTVFIAGLVLGGLIELLQYTLPINRSGDWEDLAADVVGVVVGIVFQLGLHKFWKV